MAISKDIFDDKADRLIMKEITPTIEGFPS